MQVFGRCPKSSTTPVPPIATIRTNVTDPRPHSTLGSHTIVVLRNFLGSAMSQIQNLRYLVFSFHGSASDSLKRYSIERGRI